jgi:hypothetical protein
MTSFLSNDKSFNCQTAYMTASCTTTIADTVSTAVNKCQSNVLNALQSLQNKLDMSTPNGIREQILGKTTACPGLSAVVPILSERPKSRK